MRVLVPLDVRGCADKVVDRALWLGKLAPHTKIDLLTVVPVVPHLDAGVTTLQVGDRLHALGGVLDEETAALLRGFAVLVQKHHVLGDVLARNGGPTEQILATCKARALQSDHGQPRPHRPRPRRLWLRR